MSAGYNHRCVEGSKKAIEKAKQTKKQLEDQYAQDSESRYLESEERAAKSYWDSVIEW